MPKINATMSDYDTMPMRQHLQPTPRRVLTPYESEEHRHTGAYAPLHDADCIHAQANGEKK